MLGRSAEPQVALSDGWGLGLMGAEALKPSHREERVSTSLWPQTEKCLSWGQLATPGPGNVAQVFQVSVQVCRKADPSWT